MQAQPSPKPQVSGSSATATNSCDFIETLEYSRFIEFCDACRQYRYIGLCFGAPGIGKTLSAAQYSRRDKISGLSPWTVVSIDPPLDTVLYTPPVVNTPGRVDTDLHQRPYRCFRIDGRTPLSDLARWLLNQGRWPRPIARCSATSGRSQASTSTLLAPTATCMKSRPVVQVDPKRVGQKVLPPPSQQGVVNRELAMADAPSSR